MGGMTVATVLRCLRLAAGVTQRELSDRTGLATSVISAYECGHRQPGADVFVRILDALGFRPSYRRQLDPVLQGERLAEVLELAEALPFRPRPMPRMRLGAA